jgi:hypothetical protein
MSMKRKTVYLNGTRLGAAETWLQVSVPLGYIPVRALQNHGNEGPGGFYVILENEGEPIRRSLGHQAAGREL